MSKRDMFRYLSDRTEAITELVVKLDLARRGWEALEAYKQPHDLVVYRGVGHFETMQVKRLDGKMLPTANIRLNASESTKKRHSNRHAYRDFNIDWLVGVRLEDERLFYYPLSVYSLYEDIINIEKVPPVDFPTNTIIQSQNFLRQSHHVRREQLMTDYVDLFE